MDPKVITCVVERAATGSRMILELPVKMTPEQAEMFVRSTMPGWELVSNTTLIEDEL